MPLLLCSFFIVCVPSSSKVTVRRRGHPQVAEFGSREGVFYPGSEFDEGTEGDLPSMGRQRTRRRRNPPMKSNLEVRMKMVKSLLLGSAAGLVAVSGTQAADLPVKAKPVEYVKICSLYVEGFYYIPGTDICLMVCGMFR